MPKRMVLTAETKLCTRCHLMLPMPSFRQRRNRRDGKGRYSECRRCCELDHKRHRDWRLLTDPDGVHRPERARYKARRDRQKSLDPESLRERERNKQWRHVGVKLSNGDFLTWQGFVTKFKKQPLCPICDVQMLLDGNTSKKAVADHDKNTGLFRGVVCSGCNINLINAHTFETATRLVKYLERPVAGPGV
jgi:hypothetical protein